MTGLDMLKAEVNQRPGNARNIYSYLMYQGYAGHFGEPIPISRAYAIEALFTRHEKHIYDHDQVIGSFRGRISAEIPEPVLAHADKVVKSYGVNTYWSNTDHFAPDYDTFLADGINGTLEKIKRSAAVHLADDPDGTRATFLRAAEITMLAFAKMTGQYGLAAERKAAGVNAGQQKANLLEAARICRKLTVSKPDTFHEALQLVWLVHLALVYEVRYAVALGRLDQYLYPYYEKDLRDGRLSREQAIELVGCALLKIGEIRYFGHDDIVNIAIAGRKPDGGGGLNELSFVILEAVRRCNIPGPNLSARLYKGIADEFLDACLQVIGTGLGYPALMNDEINIPALHRYGYAIEDCRNYCMVGCIENFIAGKQPPWTDDLFNSPKYLELALNNGRCMQTGVLMGPQTGDIAQLRSLDDIMAAMEQQAAYGAARHMAVFMNENSRYSRINYAQPFLSCFCRSCIERGLDVNNGGAYYPSAHGACCMGIATVADSLAAIESVVFKQRLATLAQLRDALLADFAGYEELHAQLLHAPKYGNNDDAVDQYAVWFVQFHDRIFSRYRTRDGGAVYTAIASNVDNIPAGLELAATPDGRRNRQPVSDAASPAHGADRKGPTAVMQSVAKPDYTRVACGTVLNQKYSPAMFSDPEKRARLLALIKVYFSLGGQEIQINSVSRTILCDAMHNPGQYKDLVVRVSGFSAYYTQLSRTIQEDILERTEHG